MQIEQFGSCTFALGLFEQYAHIDTDILALTNISFGNDFEGTFGNIGSHQFAFTGYRSASDYDLS